ncbi:hypothetical protein JI57_02775 [Psychromonas sp. PRT-SC03]|nr:hypothetical protein JI57_02775 [Psychromonas sp. PRT-SC03]
MRLKPMKEFLNNIEECHIALANLYANLSLKTNDKQVKHLLDFMQNKEKRSHLLLCEYTQQAPQSLLETWLENAADNDFPSHYKKMQLKENLEVQDVVNLALKLNTQLIELMQNTAYHSPTIEAEVALVHLTDREEETLHQVVKASHELEFM